MLRICWPTAPLDCSARRVRASTGPFCGLPPRGARLPVTDGVASRYCERPEFCPGAAGPCASAGVEPNPQTTKTTKQRRCGARTLDTEGRSTIDNNTVCPTIGDRELGRFAPNGG